MEKSALQSMMKYPHEGHLKEVFHMFAFLKGKHNSLMVFDITEPETDLSKFTIEYWSETSYGKCKLELTPNTPQERVIGMTMRDFVDSDNAVNMMTWRSRTGFIIFLNNAPMYWFSKKHSSIETSSLGS